VFVIETVLPYQFAWVSVFSLVKYVYMNFPKLSIVFCVSRYVRKQPLYILLQCIEIY